MHQVFFVHSDPKTISLFKPVLKPHFMVDSAHDGLTAIRKIRAHRPDLIVSDYHLPVLSGLALLKFVRSNTLTSFLPFIFLTDHQDVGAALSLGANEWINRQSIQPAELLDRINYHIKINQPALSRHTNYGL